MLNKNETIILNYWMEKMLLIDEKVKLYSKALPYQDSILIWYLVREIYAKKNVI